MSKIQIAQMKIENLESEIATLKRERARLRRKLQKMNPDARMIEVSNRIEYLNAVLLLPGMIATSNSRRILAELANAKENLKELEDVSNG